MKNKPVWLCLSLFAVRKNWSTLLKKGINPFLKNLQNDPSVIDYFLQFNSSCGENIRLALLIGKSPKHMAQRMDTYFKRFFETSRLGTRKIPLPLDGFFMPFPQNTVQYGLFNLHDGSGNYQRFKIRLSRIIFGILTEQNCKEDTLLVLAFYLHLGVIRLIENCGFGKRDEFIKHYVYIFSSEPSKKSISFWESRFIENKEVLQDIYGSIFDLNSNDNIAPEWLLQWLQLLQDFTNAEGSFGKIASVPQLLVSITRDVDEILNIKGDYKKLLSYFLKEILSFYSIKRNKLKSEDHLIPG